MKTFFRLFTLSIIVGSFIALLVWVLRSEISMNLWYVLLGLLLLPIFLAFWYLALGKSRFLVRLGKVLLILIGYFALLFAGYKSLRYEGSTSGASLPKFSFVWSEEAEEIAPADTVAAQAVNRDALQRIDRGVVADSLQFLGPERNGHLREVGFALDWSAAAPEEIWRRPVGKGWSGFSVSGNRAVTMEQFGEDEAVVCYDVFSGDRVWIHIDEQSGYLKESEHANPGALMGGAGPRSTPTIHDGKAYSLGASGILNCLDLQTGELLWKKDTLSEIKGKMPVWGISAAPLVMEDLSAIVVTGSEEAGATLLAYHLDSGKEIWRYRGRGASYSSPRLISLHGQRQIVAVNAKDVSGIDPKKGKELWTYSWPGPNPKVGQPALVGENRIFASASYGVQSPLLQIEKGAGDEPWSVTELWTTIRMKTKFSSVVIQDGYAYGIDEGRLACIDLSSGEKVWKKEKVGFGQQLLLNGSHLLIQAESGEVILGAVSSDGFSETGRIGGLSSMTWNVPTVAGRLLLIRNDQEAICYLLPEAN